MLEKNKILASVRFTCYRRQPGDAGVALLPLKSTKMSYFPYKVLRFCFLCIFLPSSPPCTLPPPRWPGWGPPFFIISSSSIWKNTGSLLYSSVMVWCPQSHLGQKKSTKVQKKYQKIAENTFWFNPFLGREAMQQQRKTQTGATKQGQRIEGGYVQYRGSWVFFPLLLRAGTKGPLPSGGVRAVWGGQGLSIAQTWTLRRRAQIWCRSDLKYYIFCKKNSKKFSNAIDDKKTLVLKH